MTAMGCFKSFYGEIICPKCGTEYKHYRPSLSQVAEHYKSYRESMKESAPKIEPLRELWAKLDGFGSAQEHKDFILSEAWLKQEQKQKWWGLVEAQNKSIGEPDCTTYYAGDLVADAPKGHLWDRGALVCRNSKCPGAQVWIELKQRRFIGLRVKEPVLRGGE